MRRLALLTLALFLASVPVALGQDTNAPPGNSGVDQYLEAVPSGSGNTSSKGVAAAKPSSASPTVAKALRSRGTSGAELERLVASTAPAKVSGSAKQRTNGAGGQGSDSSSPSAQPGASPVRAAAAATTGSGGGMGVWLPILLGIVTLAAVVALVSRVVRRRPS